MRTILRATSLVLVLGLVLVAGVYAQDEAVEEAPVEAAAAPEQPALEGTMVGDRGGAIYNYEVELPADTEITITLNHWPCMTGTAIGVKVWTPDGMLASSSEATPCSQVAKFETGAGGPAQVQFYNYLHGVGTYYLITAEGVELPGAAAPVEEPAEEEMMEEEAVETEAVDEDAVEAEDEEMVDEEADEELAADEPAEEEMVEEEPVALEGTISADNETLLGNSGGAFNEYDLPVAEGAEYEILMTYGAHGGGEHWNGVGFNVWGPGGQWIAKGKQASFNQMSAKFTGTGDVVYLIQVFNYNDGLTISYSIEAGPVVAEE